MRNHFCIYSKMPEGSSVLLEYRNYCLIASLALTILNRSIASPSLNLTGSIKGSGKTRATVLTIFQGLVADNHGRSTRTTSEAHLIHSTSFLLTFIFLFSLSVSSERSNSRTGENVHVPRDILKIHMQKC